MADAPAATVAPPLSGRKDSATDFLDGLRGLAALYVVLGHARILLHEGSFGYGQGHRYGPFSTAIYYALSGFRYGREAVLFFFVLSGFVIHLRSARQLETRTAADFKLGDFLKRRALRLYPPLILALLLTAALDSLGMHLGYLVYSGNTAYPMINLILSANHGFTVALGNLAFLMTVYVPVFGTNGPLWSLMFEWWFYVIYALIWRLIARSLGWSTLLIIVLSVASHWPRIWPFELPRIVFSMMDVWWMGLLLAEAYAGRIRVRMAYLAFLTVLFVPALAYDQAVYNWSRLCWGGGFCGLIACGFALQNSGHALWPLNRLRELGRMSYTLYVCHMPMLALMSGALMAASPDKSLPRGFGPLFLGVMIILAACWLAHFVVEQPFLRRR